MYLQNGIEFLKPTPKLRELLFLLNIDSNPRVSQNALGRTLGLAPSMVNRYIQSMEEKGFIRMDGKTNRTMSYYLTEVGKRKKMQLLVSYSVEVIRMYMNAKGEFSKRLRQFADEGIRSVVFFGAGDTAEVALNCVKRSGLDLLGVVDNDPKKHGTFFGDYEVKPPSVIEALHPEGVVITSFGRQDEIYEEISYLEDKGIKVRRI